MLSHFATTDGNEVLPSQFPSLFPQTCFNERDWHKVEVWQVCESLQRSLLSSLKKIWKRKIKITYLHFTTNIDERRKKKTTRNLLSQWKQGFLSSVISLRNPPTLTKSWATYLFGQWKTWILGKISFWSSTVPDILAINGHTGAGISHSIAILRPTLHLRLLWGQPHIMNKVVLEVDITYKDKKMFLLILVPILSEAIKTKAKVFTCKNNIWHFCQHSKLNFGNENQSMSFKWSSVQLNFTI